MFDWPASIRLRTIVLSCCLTGFLCEKYEGCVAIPSEIAAFGPRAKSVIHPDSKILQVERPKLLAQA